MIRRNMRTTFVLTAVLALFAVQGQTQVENNPKRLFSISFYVVPNKISVGKPVNASLFVQNITDREHNFPEEQIYVQGDAGEPPMTLRHRQLTGHLNPGDPALMMGGYSPPIEPGETSVRYYNLLDHYDLSKPGKYTAYVEIIDIGERRITGKANKVRSPLATFEIVPAS